MQRVIKQQTPTLEKLQVPDELLQPVRAQSLEADVLVPLAKAKWTGILLGLTAFVLIATVQHLLRRELLDLFLSSLIISAITGLVATVIAWFVFESLARENLYKIEQSFGADINRDGFVGRPPKTQMVLVNPNRGRAKQQVDLAAIKMRKLSQFIDECYSSRHTDLTYWVREGRINEKLYIEFRDDLLQAGYAHRKYDGAKSGWCFNENLDAATVIDLIQNRENDEDTNESNTESTADET